MIFFCLGEEDDSEGDRVAFLRKLAKWNYIVVDEPADYSFSDENCTDSANFEQVFLVRVRVNDRTVCTSTIH